MMDNLKKQLRRDYRARRLALQAAQPDAADQAAEVFATAPPDAVSRIGAIRIAALYHPVGSELNPAPLAKVLEARGVEIALPVVLAADASLVFRLRGVAPMTVDAAGILTPPPSAPLVTPDLVIVPLLAYGDRGARLGQGGGFYDRTLAQLRAEGRVLALGLAYAGQNCDDIPIAGHDQKLDGVLTEVSLRWFY